MRSLIVSWVAAVIITAGCTGSSNPKAVSPSVVPSTAAPRSDVSNPPAASTSSATVTPTALLLSACKFLSPTVPADQTRIAPPGSDVPASLARYSGAWEGLWGNLNASTFVVRALTPTGGTALYVFTGTASNMMLVAQPDGSLKSGNGLFLWTMNPDNTLDGKLFNQGGQRHNDALRTFGIASEGR